MVSNIFFALHYRTTRESFLLDANCDPIPHYSNTTIHPPASQTNTATIFSNRSFTVLSYYFITLCISYYENRAT
jgi:hypothetical protein